MIIVRPRLADLQARLTHAEVERRILEARIKALEGQTSEGQANVPDTMVDKAVEENVEVQAHKAQLAGKRAALRARLEEIEEKLVQPEKDDFCRRLEKEIERDEQIRAASEEKGTSREETETA